MPGRNRHARGDDRARGDECTGADRRAVEHDRAVGDDALPLEDRAVHDAVVADRHALADVGREPGRAVNHRVVLHVGAPAHDHRCVVGADDHAVPDRRVLLDDHVADERRGGRDECRGMNPRLQPFEREQRHGPDSPLVVTGTLARRRARPSRPARRRAAARVAELHPVHEHAAVLTGRAGDAIRRVGGPVGPLGARRQRELDPQRIGRRLATGERVGVGQARASRATRRARGDRCRRARRRARPHVEPVRPRFHQPRRDERRRAHPDAPRHPHVRIERLEHLVLGRGRRLPPRQHLGSAAAPAVQHALVREVLARSRGVGPLVDRARRAGRGRDRHLVGVGEMRDRVAHVPTARRRRLQPQRRGRSRAAVPGARAVRP